MFILFVLSLLIGSSIQSISTAYHFSEKLFHSFVALIFAEFKGVKGKGEFLAPSIACNAQEMNCTLLEMNIFQSN